MIPKQDNDSIVDFAAQEEQTSRTYKLQVEREIVNDFTDELEAMKQAIYLILMTERYQNLIYSYNYGVELADLIGTQKSFALPELKRRITEALMQDDRVVSVDGFDFESGSRSAVAVRFTVNTVFGNVLMERTVQL